MLPFDGTRFTYFIDNQCVSPQAFSEFKGKAYAVALRAEGNLYRSDVSFIIILFHMVQSTVINAHGGNAAGKHGDTSQRSEEANIQDSVGFPKNLR